MFIFNLTTNCFNDQLIHSYQQLQATAFVTQYHSISQAKGRILQNIKMPSIGIYYLLQRNYNLMNLWQKMLKK